MRRVEKDDKPPIDPFAGPPYWHDVRGSLGIPLRPVCLDARRMRSLPSALPDPVAVDDAPRESKEDA